MVVADVVEHGRRGEAGDVAAHVGVAVGRHHHGHGVPADVVADALLQLEVPGERRLPRHRDGVHVRGLGGEGEAGAVPPGPLDELLDEEVGPLRAFPHQHAVEAGLAIEERAGFTAEAEKWW